MTTLTLHSYLQKINQLLDDNRFTEVVSHCRHILEQYPRHIDTYRVLAKALLEQHQYENAADLFQRVLSVDPNDLVAHVGLADIYKQDSLLDQSLWHLERAFELEPYNLVIQDELRHLYAQRNDMNLGRIPLNQGALAHIYVREELYEQAVRELRQALSQNGDRIDLEVILAEALWRDEQRVAAAEVCQHILEQLPNCIVANAILADIWLQADRAGDAQRCLQHVQALTQIDSRHLDPETAVGHAFSLEGAPSLPAAIKIEVLEAAPLEAASAAPAADWVSEVTFPSEAAEQPAAEGASAASGQLEDGPGEDEQPQDVYDWLGELDEEATQAARDSDFEDVAELFGESEPMSLDELADSAADMPSWLSDETAAEGRNRRMPESQEIPDWLSDQPTVDSESTFDEEATEPAEVPSEMPDWLAAVSSADDFEPMEVDPSLASEWFGKAQDEATEGEDESTVSVGGQPEVADEWLTELAERYGADTGEPEEVSTDAEPAATAEDSDWLTTEFEESLFQEELATDDDSGSGDDWLAALTRDTDELPAQPGTEDEAPWLSESTGWLAEDTANTEYGDEVTDWLLGSDLIEQDKVEEVMAGVPVDDNDKKDSSLEDVPEPEDEVSDELDNSMAWLDALTAEQDESEPSVMDELAGETLPDWLADLSAPTESQDDSTETTPVYDDNIPDWLRASSLDDELLGLEGEEAEAATTSEDELSYLDRIAAGEGSPIDEPPTQVSMASGDMTADEDETEVTGWLSELESEGSQDEDEEGLDWLDQIATGAKQPSVVDQVPTLAWSDELDEEEPALDWLSELAAAPDDTLINLGREQMEADSDQGDAAEEKDTVAEVPEDLDDAMAWLEELAAQQGAPVEELPTVANVLERDTPSETVDEEDVQVVADAEAESEAALSGGRSEETAEPFADVPDDLDDAMAWLEQLAAQQGAPLEELPSLSEIEEETGAEPDREVMAMKVEEASGVEEADVLLPEPDEALAEAEIDLDEAMAWLEELVEKQDAPIETSVEETVPEEAEPAAAADAITAHDELEEALDWLEQLALEEGDLAVGAVGEPSLLENDAVAVTDDELGEALDWLEQVAAASQVQYETESEGEVDSDMLAEEEEADETPVLPVESAQAIVAGSSQAVEEEAEPELDFLADMPDDPDEAMAWLERLAARQGAPLDELPSISAEEGEDITTLAEDFSSRAEAEVVIAEAETASPQAIDEVEVTEDVDVIGRAEAEATIEEVEVPSPQIVDEAEVTEDVDVIGRAEAEATIEEVEVPSPQIVDEAEVTEDVDVMDWLAAEEEATVISSEEPTRLPETGPLVEVLPAEMVTEQPPVKQPLAAEEEAELDVEDESLILAESEPMTSALSLDEAQLARARQALADADYDEAIQTYQSLVTKGEGLITLIGDLETAVDRHPRWPLLQRVLGDAYMRNGQLQKALETYRQTLDHL